MVKSLHTAAAAMAHCSALMEDYANLSPGLLVKPSSADHEVNFAVPGGKKAKKEKDPNAPKRPTSAYLLYQNDVRAKIKAENPEMPYRAMMGLMAEQWSKMTEAEKKVGVALPVLLTLPRRTTTLTPPREISPTKTNTSPPNPSTPPLSRPTNPLAYVPPLPLPLPLAPTKPSRLTGTRRVRRRPPRSRPGQA